MMYSSKVRLDRRNSIIAAVKKELKAHNAFIAPEALRKLAEALNTSRYYGVEVIRSADRAAESLRLKDHKTTHSWAGGDGFEESCVTVVVGKITMGEDFFHEYFDNSNPQGPSEGLTDGEFNVNEPFIFLRHTEDWRLWEGDSCNHDDSYDTIIIYAPESIIDEDAYIAQKDAELTELCQLRDGK